MAVIFLKDGTNFETPDDNIVNVERLLGEKIKDISYTPNPFADAINELAKKQAALWEKQPEVTQPIKKQGRPKKVVAAV